MFSKSDVDRLFSVNPPIRSLLVEAKTLRIARNLLFTYITELRRTLLQSQNSSSIDGLQWSLQMSCLVVFRTMLSKRSAKLCKFDLSLLLWRLAHERWDKLPDDLSTAFFADLTHILRGISGVSNVYAQESVTVQRELHGRPAARHRSTQLDLMAERSEKYIHRYISGLAAEVKTRRETTKAEILRVLGGTEDDWNQPSWQLKHIIRDSQVLGRIIDLTQEEQAAIDLAIQGGLPFGITPYYAHLMDKEPHRRHDNAVRAQVIPPLDYVQKMLQHRDNRAQSFDFMLEHDTSPIDLITRRYPRIVIFKPYNTCSQICVYCQRNWEISDVLAPGALASQSSIDDAIQWITDTQAISEVLITGGDPLVMQDDTFCDILARVSAITHVDRIRIGSRIPVVMPMRITERLADRIAEHHLPGVREIALITHFEHPYEITAEAMEAVQKFRRRGMSAYNQTVFTVENSRRFENVALRRWLRLIGIDPYYTFNTKGKEETRAYRVPMARLQQEVTEEARLFPGLMRTDEAVYNVPGLGKNYLRAEQNHTLLSILPDGSRVYEFHPWEKYCALAATFVDHDVPIYDYLQELERRGENLEEYKTIYYYF